VGRRGSLAFCLPTSPDQIPGATELQSRPLVLLSSVSHWIANDITLVLLLYSSDTLSQKLYRGLWPRNQRIGCMRGFSKVIACCHSSPRRKPGSSPASRGIVLSKAWNQSFLDSGFRRNDDIKLAQIGQNFWQPAQNRYPHFFCEIAVTFLPFFGLERRDQKFLH
jgi:hypothetical protein